MTVTLGINGFGRIGRCTLAHIAESSRNDVQVVKINATGPIETNAHLLRYDSVHGRFGGEVKIKGNTMDLGRGPMEMFSTYNPQALDWSGCGVVLETVASRSTLTSIRCWGPARAGVLASSRRSRSMPRRVVTSRATPR